MADCCTPQTDDSVHPKKRPCPACGAEGSEVSVRTIAHHLKQTWQWQERGARYYFCAEPSCDTVYFADDGSTLLKSRLRTQVGVKESAGDAPLCYCFGVSRADALNNPAIREYVVTQTRLAQCSCDTRNPSGRCCLKDFPRTEDA